MIQFSTIWKSIPREENITFKEAVFSNFQEDMLLFFKAHIGSIFKLLGRHAISNLNEAVFSIF